MDQIKSELFSYYNDLPYYHRLFVKKRIQLIPLDELDKTVQRQGNIVELGCGHGIVSNYLALTSRERNVIGIDFDKERIQWANTTVTGRDNIKFICDDITQLKVETVDVVILFGVLCLIPFEHWDNLFKKIFQSLRKGGSFILHDIKVTNNFKFYLHIAREHLFRIIKITKAKGLFLKNDVELIRQISNHGFFAKPFGADVQWSSTLNYCFIKI